MRQRKHERWVRKLLFRRMKLLPGVVIAAFVTSVAAQAQILDEIRNSAGVRLGLDAADRDPALLMMVPDGPEDDAGSKILLPEHVTVRAHCQTEQRHLYVFRPGSQGDPPAWKRVGNAFEYAKDFGQIHFIARATMLANGILFHYEFINHSTTDYDMATAVTDPRFHTVFYDPRLERTYVHHKGGFDLLASETPARLTMPLQEWFPVRYLAQYTAPIPAERVQRGEGITYYYKSKPVDVPMVATLSADRTWVAASFAHDTGNVWSNPELTCQHVDPEVSLPKGVRAVYEVKILVFKGSLEDALRKVKAQSATLKQLQSH